MPRTDNIEKILFAYNDVFADIVNVIIYGGRQKVKENELIDCNTSSYYKAELEEKEDIHGPDRDVSKIRQRENIKISLFGIENQSKPDADMALRIMGYDGAFYREQLNNKEIPCGNR